VAGVEAMETVGSTRRGVLRDVASRVALPVGVYFSFFVLYTWPWITQFNTHFFANNDDGLQNVWNIWWVDRAITRMHQLPWHTSMLHAPSGTSLLGQTLNPFNGFVGVVLLRFFTLTQTFNILVIFSFVMGGLTAFWLCLYFTHRIPASLVGGFIFTFSAYHLAIATGLMQLVSLEWIPLFLLLWWKLLERPSTRLGVGAAVSLLLVLLCDYYYFLYSIAAAAGIGFYLWRARRAHASRALEAFGLVAFVLCTPLALGLLLSNSRDKLLGAHNARTFSTDVLATFVDGGRWRFGSLTHWYWQHFKPFYFSGSTIYLGVAVTGALIAAAIGRKRIHRDVLFWLVLAAVFWIFSLGPRLLIVGETRESVPLPYALLEHIFPPLRIGGTPVRMMVIVSLAAAVVSAMVLAHLDLSRTGPRVLFAAFGLVLVLEMWPSRLPSTAAVHPAYVDALAKLPGNGAVYDQAARLQGLQLYYQTVHQKRLALGYISRIPASVEKQDLELVGDVVAGRWGELCDRYGIRYFATPAAQPLTTSFPVVYRDADALIYDLRTSPTCD
jgi:hypothetical protein